ncbi:hypothetical protein DXG01_001572 [Tephrocybe rancida]|nr:hypothetical protein DXG01_001572 [Tephrocybe rancida]
MLTSSLVFDEISDSVIVLPKSKLLSWDGYPKEILGTPALDFLPTLEFEALFEKQKLCLPLGDIEKNWETVWKNWIILWSLK